VSWGVLGGGPPARHLARVGVIDSPLRGRRPPRRRAAPAHRLGLTAGVAPDSSRRLRIIAAVAVLAVSACALVATSGVLDAYASQVVDDAAQMGGALFASWCCWSTWRRDVHAGRPRGVWLWRLLLFVGVTGWAFGQAVWSWYQLVGGQPLPSPSLADVGYFTLPLFAVPAVLALPSTSPNRDPGASGFALGGRRARLLLAIDALVIVGSLFVLAWSTSLGAAVHGGAATRAEFAVAVGYPLTDLVMVVIVLLIAVFRRPRHPQVLLLLGAGLVALSASDSFFLYVVSFGADDMPPIYDVGFMLAPVLLGLAALAPEPASRTSAASAQAREAAWFMLLPYLPLCGIGLLVVVQQVTGTPVDAAETFGLIALAGVVVVRQLLTLAENLDLLRRVREGQERLHHQAFHDWLTGLPNRALFRERLEVAVERHGRGGHGLAVLFFDLDDFKEVNDTLGHAAGDELLKVAAQRLRRGVRAGDTVARLGGDEFAVVLDGADAAAEPPVMACERLLAALGRPILLGGTSVVARASAGLVVVEPGERGVTADLVLHQADAAMYTAKRAGKGHLVTHLQGGDDAPAPNLAVSLGRVLYAAASSPAPQALALVYQPIVRLADGVTVAVEALTRWKRDGESVAPEFLVQTAENAGLMGRLQEWILCQACLEVAVLRRGPWPNVAVHVNVPASLVVEQALVAQVRQALARHNLPGEALVLEVTETGRIDDFAAAADVLEDVRRLGVRVALDDFGAGHSNLNHLLRLPVDVLKLDRALTAGVVEPGRAQAVSGGAVNMARRLGIPIIAEGVEQQQQAARLAELGCEYAQGFLFARPRPVAELSRSIPTDTARAAAPQGRRAARAGDGQGLVKPVMPI
jgi:diguanylate cyclase (GGDEF)-like protein